jgi:hypothetical protein
MLMNILPSWIKPNTAAAFNHAYTFLYCNQNSEVRKMIDKVKDGYEIPKEDNSFAARHARLFFLEVKRMAQFEPSFEDLKALERSEKVQGIHPSQQKKVESATVPEKPVEKAEEKIEQEKKIKEILPENPPIKPPEDASEIGGS